MPIIQSVERALAILDLFDEHNAELKMTEISSRMKLHKSTVHALLKTLQQFRYIEQNEESGKYRLGMKLLDRSSQVLHSLSINREARPVLTEIARVTGQTAHLVILDGAEGVYIDKVEGAKAVIKYSRIGRRIPLHCSAVGKVLSAYLPEERLRAILRDYRYERHTERTIGSEREFLAELENVRLHGFATDNEENEPGVRCVAVPIRGHTGEVIAAVSISMLISRVTEEEFDDYRRLLCEQAERLSARMGYGWGR